MNEEGWCLCGWVVVVCVVVVVTTHTRRVKCFGLAEVEPVPSCVKGRLAAKVWLDYEGRIVAMVVEQFVTAVNAEARRELQLTMLPISGKRLP